MCVCVYLSVYFVSLSIVCFRMSPLGNISPGRAWNLPSSLLCPQLWAPVEWISWWRVRGVLYRMSRRTLPELCGRYLVSPWSCSLGGIWQGGPLKHDSCYSVAQLRHLKTRNWEILTSCRSELSLMPAPDTRRISSAGEGHPLASIIRAKTKFLPRSSKKISSSSFSKVWCLSRLWQTCQGEKNGPWQPGGHI